MNDFKNRHGYRAPPGPATGSNATFMCACCGLAKLAAGRRKVGRRFHCAACVKAAAEAACAT